MSSPFDLNQFNELLGSLTERLTTMKNDASRIEVEGRAGGDAVFVRMNGEFQALQVRIAPSAMEDRELLEDLVAAAVNDAVRRVQEVMASKMSEFAAGLPIPPDFR